MKALFYLYVLLATLWLSSCAIYLAPTMSGGNNIGYLPRPTSADSAKVTTYVSGEISYAEDNSADLIYTLGALNVSRGHNIGQFNFGYGLFGFAGIAD